MKTNWDTKFMGDEPKLMSKYKHQQAIREELDKELGSYKIDGKEFREMWGLFDLVVVFLDEQLKKKEEEVIENLKMKELPEFYEQAIKVTYGWAQDLDVDDARIGYNQAVKELNKKIEQLKTQTKK